MYSYAGSSKRERQIDHQMTESNPQPPEAGIKSPKPKNLMAATGSP